MLDNNCYRSAILLQSGFEAWRIRFSACQLARHFNPLSTRGHFPKIKGFFFIFVCDFLSLTLFHSNSQVPLPPCMAFIIYSFYLDLIFFLIILLLFFSLSSYLLSSIYFPSFLVLFPSLVPLLCFLRLQSLSLNSSPYLLSLTGVLFLPPQPYFLSQFLFSASLDYIPCP